MFRVGPRYGSMSTPSIERTMDDPPHYYIYDGDRILCNGPDNVNMMRVLEALRIMTILEEQCIKICINCNQLNLASYRGCAGCGASI